MSEREQKRGEDNVLETSATDIAQEHFTDAQFDEMVNNQRKLQNELNDDYLAADRDPRSGKTVANQHIEREQNLIKEFIDCLKAQKERFQSVFETDKGSIYFTLQSGKTLRIRFGMTAAGIKGFDLQPMTAKLFFVDTAQSLTVEETVRYGLDSLIGQRIRKVPLMEGAHPVEMNATMLNDEIVFTEDEESITLLGTRAKDKPDEVPQDQIYGGFHFGHAIKHILKR